MIHTKHLTINEIGLILLAEPNVITRPSGIAAIKVTANIVNVVKNPCNSVSVTDKNDTEPIFYPFLLLLNTPKGRHSKNYVCLCVYVLTAKNSYLMRLSLRPYLSAISSSVPSAMSSAVISFTFETRSEPVLKPIPYSSTARSRPSITIRSA